MNVDAISRTHGFMGDTNITTSRCRTTTLTHVRDMSEDLNIKLQAIIVTES